MVGELASISLKLLGGGLGRLNSKINSTSGEALKQIKDRGYAVGHEAGKRKILLIGANFSTKNRTLTDWIIEAG